MWKAEWKHFKKKHYTTSGRFYVNAVVGCLFTRYICTVANFNNFKIKGMVDGYLIKHHTRTHSNASLQQARKVVQKYLHTS